MIGVADVQPSRLRQCRRAKAKYAAQART